MLTQMLQLILHSQIALHNLKFNNKRRWNGENIPLTRFDFPIQLISRRRDDFPNVEERVFATYTL